MHLGKNAKNGRKRTHETTKKNAVIVNFLMTSARWSQEKFVLLPGATTRRFLGQAGTHGVFYPRLNATKNCSL